MRVVSFEDLLSSYEPTYLRDGYEKKRKEMFEKYPFSVLVEGGYQETDGLEKWIAANIGADQINWLFHIKTGYDFGFTEFFFTDQQAAARVSHIVPHIYIKYDHEDDPFCSAFRTAGPEKQIKMDLQDPNAIVYDAEW